MDCASVSEVRVKTYYNFVLDSCGIRTVVISKTIGVEMHDTKVSAAPVFLSQEKES